MVVRARSLVGALGAAAALVLAPPVARAGTGEAPRPLIEDLATTGARGVSIGRAAEAPRPLIEDLTRFDDQTTTVPQHAPLPEGADGIGPGSQLLITIPEEGTFGCTANFVWAAGQKRYLGSAGHCFLPSWATATHGPGADYDPSRVTVRACVAKCLTGGTLGGVIRGTFVTLGPVVYARQRVGAEGIGNDFGLVEVPPAWAGAIRPSMPVFGGPTGVESNSGLKPVCHYGHGRHVGSLFVTRGRAGIGLGGNQTRWTARVVVAPGDSGSAIEVCEPHGSGSGDVGLHGAGAVGIITHGTVEPVVATVPLGQGFGTTVSRAVEMATEAGLAITLVTAPA